MEIEATAHLSAERNGANYNAAIFLNYGSSDSLSWHFTPQVLSEIIWLELAHVSNAIRIENARHASVVTQACSGSQR
jgi:3-dehydroquinate dehydratase